MHALATSHVKLDFFIFLPRIRSNPEYESTYSQIRIRWIRTGFDAPLWVDSRSVEQHVKDLHSVVSLLAEHDLHLKESKCALFLETVEFLGHTISAKGLEVE